MRSFTVDRLKPKWADLIVAVLLVAAAGGILLALRPETEGKLTAVVTLDGVEVARQELDGLKDSILMEVEGAEYPITVEFAPGKVRIHDTQCPSKDCYAMGWVDWNGGQIVCLPNRLAIALEGNGTPDIDAVTG